jgi:hypothetical protein
MDSGIRRRAFVGLVLAAAAAVTACSPPAVHPRPTTAFGVLSASCRPDRVAAEVRAGVTIAVMDLGWDRYEPAPGQVDLDYVNSVRRQIATCTQAGLQVVLSPGLQYPPSWVHRLPAGDYRDQTGAAPSGRAANLVFSQAVRDAAANHLRHIDRDLVLRNFHAVRVGTSSAGELGYPGPNEGTGHYPHSYWAFDTAAQTGVGLAAGLSPSPLPGWPPGSPTWQGRPVTTADATRWFRWYDRALVNTITWQLGLLRQLGYTGEVHLPLAGRGVLPPDLRTALDARLNGSGDPDGSLERGLDYLDQLPLIARAAAPLPGHSAATGTVAVDMTGVDDATAVLARAEQPPQDTCQPSDVDAINTAGIQFSRWSSLRWTSAVARHVGLPVLGENPGPPTTVATGGSPDSDTETAQMIYAPAYATDCHLAALLWAFEDDLFSATPGATINDYATAIHRSGSR